MHYENGIPTKPSVCIVTLNWNSSSDTLAFLESLKNLRYDNYHTLVIDNNSNEIDYENLRLHSKDVELIRSEYNLGFAGGCNKGAEHAFSSGHEYVWFVNNDAKASIIGLRWNDKFPEIIRSFVEGLCFAARECYNAIGDMPNEIRIVGGGFQSESIRKIFSSVLKVSVTPFSKKDCLRLFIF